MRELIAIENDIETRFGTLLTGMMDDQAWSRLRFSEVGHYAEERLGMSRTAAEDRVRVTRAREATVKRLRDEARLIGRRAGMAAEAAAGPAPHQPSSDAEWHASLRREPGNSAAAFDTRPPLP